MTTTYAAAKYYTWEDDRGHVVIIEEATKKMVLLQDGDVVRDVLSYEELADFSNGWAVPIKAVEFRVAVFEQIVGQ